MLEPIPEEWIQDMGFGLVRRLSMMRIMASRTKAATVLAYRSKSRERRRHRLIQAKVLSTIHRLGKTTKPLAMSLRLTISTFQVPVLAAVARTRGP